MLSYLPIFLAAENFVIAAAAAQPNQTIYTPINISPHHVRSIIDHFSAISCQI
jgi:hypothetical protein